MEIIDITYDLFEAPIYPSDPEPEYEFVSKIEDGATCNLSTIFACVHNGTHTDAPYHFIEDGITAEKLPLENFIGECTVLTVRKGAITGEYVDNNFPECERLLLKSEGKAYFTDDGAYAAAALGYKLIGTDNLSVGTHGAQTRPHRAFLSENISILEGLKLDEAEDGRYFLVALPMKNSGLDGAITRAVLIKSDIVWYSK